MTETQDTAGFLAAVLAAPPERRPAILRAAAHGDNDTGPTSLRMLRVCVAVRESGLSRQTIWRCVRVGRLHAVEVRKGSFRIPEDSLRSMARGVRT
jgi:hypothetical protein